MMVEAAAVNITAAISLRQKYKHNVGLDRHP